MFNKRKIFFAKLKDKAIIPNKKDENAGYDVFACFDDEFIKIEPHETKLIPLGIAWACNKNFYMQIEERSSTGLKGLKRSAGIVDSGYRGELKVEIHNANIFPVYISNISENELVSKEKIKGKFLYYSTQNAIAQAVIHKVEKTRVKEINYDNLLKIKSTRMKEGWGSSNKV